MKKIQLTSLALAALLMSVSRAGAEKSKNENMVLPDTELIDAPTAGILDQYGFMIKTRFYSGGGVMGLLNFGVQERLNLGASMAVDRLLGDYSSVKMRRPEIRVKFRFYDGGYYIPAFAVGYEGQGYHYDQASKKYMEKGKGLYLAGSKEIGIPNLMAHGGFNISDFDKNYILGFIGASYTMEDKVSFLVEYDNLFHSTDPSRLNVGARVYITPYFQLDLAVRELGKNSLYSNGDTRKPERIVQMRYNTNF